MSQEPGPALHPFAVVACSSCRRPWAVETRHANAKCPNCRTNAQLAGKRRLWEGPDAAGAQAAAAQHASLLAGAPLLKGTPAPVRRHDNALEAAAASARGIANKSQRAEMVALTLTRAQGASPHDQLVQAMLLAGLDAERAQKEVVRMLACDVLTEPRAGRYAVINP